MKKPVIGIVPLVDAGRESLWMLPGYMELVKAAGGVPVMMPLTEKADNIEVLLDLCDGFLITGGHDVDPACYGEEAMSECGELCPLRDRMERPLFLGAIERDKPVLGICRGLQAMNVILGGDLYQDIPKQRPSGVDHHMDAPYGRTAHPIRLVEGSPLAQCLGALEAGVNSCHHQAVRTLAPRLKSMAEAPDGVIEAVYMPDRRFVWAVQWHPEFYGNNPDSHKIFEAFIKSC